METVAPHAGAWIETGAACPGALPPPASHPTRVRGLKQRQKRRARQQRPWSHPTRVRGLKRGHRRQSAHCLDRVAPHAGAWIETDLGARMGLSPRVAPHAGAWIETGA